MKEDLEVTRRDFMWTAALVSASAAVGRAAGLPGAGGVAELSVAGGAEAAGCWAMVVAPVRMPAEQRMRDNFLRINGPWWV